MLYELKRFVFSQVPLASTIVRKVLKKNRYHIDAQHGIRVFSSWQKIFQNAAIDLKSKTVLELGTGDSNGLGYCFLAAGCEKFIFTDKYKRRADSNIQLTRDLADMKTIAEHFGVTFEYEVKNNELHITHPKTEFLYQDAVSLDKVASNSVDMVISNTVLEYVPPRLIDKSAEEMYRVLKPGGIMCHQIDFRDVSDFNNHFQMLRYGNFVWDHILTKEGKGYINRWRYGDYKKLWERHNFQIIAQDTSMFKLSAQPKPLVHRDFSTRFEGEDFSILSCLFVVKKNLS